MSPAECHEGLAVFWPGPGAGRTSPIMVTRPGSFFWENWRSSDAILCKNACWSLWGWWSARSTNNLSAFPLEALSALGLGPPLAYGSASCPAPAVLREGLGAARSPCPPPPSPAFTHLSWHLCSLYSFFSSPCCSNLGCLPTAELNHCPMMRGAHLRPPLPLVPTGSLSGAALPCHAPAHPSRAAAGADLVRNRFNSSSLG